MRPFRIITVFMSILILNACAGTVGDPAAVKKILESRYVGKSVDQAMLDLGPVSEIQQMTNDNKLYSWEKNTSKYESNKLIKSDEYCRLSMMIDASDKVSKIATVDDSLGAWQFSYCREQYNF